MSHRCQVYVPADYSRARRWPVTLFLHGSGEHGSDGILQTSIGLGEGTPATRQLIACALLALASGCGPGRERAAEPELHRERLALGASFVGGRASGLRELLHGDLIVQPPAPDTPLRGSAAAEYLERLAKESRVTRSELLPVSLTREGGFLLERGGWHLESGDRTFASRYLIRWRESPAGWKLVFWRWTLFR